MKRMCADSVSIFKPELTECQFGLLSVIRFYGNDLNGTAFMRFLVQMLSFWL